MPKFEITYHGKSEVVEHPTSSTNSAKLVAAVRLGIPSREIKIRLLTGR